jgi:hypothetical protein
LKEKEPKRSYFFLKEKVAKKNFVPDFWTKIIRKGLFFFLKEKEPKRTSRKSGFATFSSVLYLYYIYRFPASPVWGVCGEFFSDDFGAFSPSCLK